MSNVKLTLDQEHEIGARAGRYGAATTTRTLSDARADIRARLAGVKALLAERDAAEAERDTALVERDEASDVIDTVLAALAQVDKMLEAKQ